MDATASGQRFMIWASIVGAVLFGVGYCALTGFFPPPPANLSAADVAQLYAHENMRLRIGVVLCIAAAGFNAPWSVAVAVQMARLETRVPIWAILQLVAGALGTVIFMLPALFWGAAAFSAGRDPSLTLLMHELAFLTLVTPVSYFWLQALPIAVVSLANTHDHNSAFPRWVGYLTIWVIVCAEMGVLAQLFKTGPFAWNGLFTFWLPLTLFTLWFGAICYTMLRAITRQAGAVASDWSRSRGEVGILG